jgi:hypothetical protein
LADEPCRTIGLGPPRNTLSTMRLPSLPTSRNRPAWRALRTRLRANVFSAEPTPPWRHSTLTPVDTRAIRLRAISDRFVACSR